MKHIKVTIFAIMLLISIAGCAHNGNLQISQDENSDLSKKEVAVSVNSESNVNNSIDSTIKPAPSSKNLSAQFPGTINTIKSGSVNTPQKRNAIKICPPSLSDDITPIPPDPDIEGVGNTSDTPAKKRSQKNNAQILMDEALDYCQMSQELWQNGELENAVEALDQAYSLILSVEIDDNNANLAQQKEDIRFTISKRILEIYASRNFAVNGNHKAIPMLLNSHVQAEINHFTTGIESNFFKASLKRSGRYREKIVDKFKKAGIPVELSWLPLIESGFKVTALSPARALGLWQFIPSTGYKFGLKRDMFVDERLDPMKSTDAAIDYLKELHQMFGDWTTVLAAYNCGEGRVLSVIRDQNVNYLDNFWDLYEKLPRETARYVPRFLATLHILANPDKYGIDMNDMECPVEYEIVDITKQINIKDIAKEIGVEEMLLRGLNPELRYCILPPKQYPLKVPQGKGSELLVKIDSISVSTITPAPAKPQSTIAYYKVKRGDTLSAVARRYGISAKELMSYNKMRKPILRAGTMLKVPARGSSSLSKTESEKPSQRSGTHKKQTITHTVKSGESISILAKRYDTTIKKIQDQNNLNTLNLLIGQTLYISKADDYNQNEKILKKYRVKRGDNLFKISQKYNMELARLLRINKLRPKSAIHPGQYVYVE